MTRFRFLIFVIITHSMIIGCNGRGAIPQDDTACHSIEIKSNINSPISPNILHLDTSFIHLKFSADTTKFIGTILDMAFDSDDRFYILELQTSYIYQFDKNSGEYINGLFNIGRGPNEHIEICDIDVDKDKLYLLDNTQNKISVYDSQLNRITHFELPMPTLAFSVCNDTLWGRGFSATNGDVKIYCCNTKGQIISEFDDGTNIADPLSSFSTGGNIFSKKNSQIYYKPDFRNSIKQLTKDSIYNSININFIGYNTEPNDTYDEINESKASLYNCFILDNRIYFSFHLHQNLNVCLYNMEKKSPIYGRIEYKKETMPFVIRWQDNNTLIGYKSVTSTTEYRGIKLNEGDIVIALMKKNTQKIL